MPTVTERASDENYLCDATKKALEILTNNARRKGGFLLMVEASQIRLGGACQQRSGHFGRNARLRSGRRRGDGLCRRASGHAGRRDGRSRDVGPVDHEQRDRFHCCRTAAIGYHFGTTGHSGTMVPVYLYGTGAERINGVMDNTELSKKIQSLMGLE